MNVALSDVKIAGEVNVLIDDNTLERDLERRHADNEKKMNRKKHF